MARLRGCKRAHSAPIRDPLASFVQLHNMEMTSACQRRGRAVNPVVSRAGERPGKGYSSINSKLSEPSTLPSGVFTAPEKWLFTILPASVNWRSVFGFRLS